jgi:hypothetical protein
MTGEQFKKIVAEFEAERKRKAGPTGRPLHPRTKAGRALDARLHQEFRLC